MSIDPVLLQVVDTVERTNAMFEVSLVIGGRLFNGFLITEEAWLRVLAKQLAGLAGEEESESAMLQAAFMPRGEEEDVETPEASPEERHLHLAVAENGGYVARWRIRLTDVSGWMLVASTD